MVDVKDIQLFWTLGLSEEVISNRPCPLVRLVGWSVFKYLRDSSLVFSNFLYVMRHQSDTKVTELDF